MKKKLFLIFITLITIIIINPLKVNAEEGPIMAIDCGEIPESYTGNFPGEKLLFYKITKNDDTFWYMYDGKEAYSIKMADNDNKKGIQWKDAEEKKYYSSEEIEKMLNSGKCPISIESYDTDAVSCNTDHCNLIREEDQQTLLLTGITTAKTIYRLEKNEYYVIKITSELQRDNLGYGETQYYWKDFSKPKVYVFYYNNNGAFRIFNNEKYLNKINSESIDEYQTSVIKNNIDKFYELNENNEFFNFQKSQKFTNNKDEAGASDEYYEYVFGSRISKNNLTDQIETWYNDNYSEVESSSNIYNEIKTKYPNLLNNSKNFNEESSQNKTYNFGTSYTVNNFINDLESAKEILKTYNPNFKLCSSGGDATLTNSLVNCVLEKSLGSINYVLDDQKKQIGGEAYKFLYNVIVEDFQTKYPDISVEAGTGGTNSLTDLITTLTTSVVYLDQKYMNYDIDKTRISSLREEYQTIASNHNITIPLDCQGLLGQELIDKINSYLKIIKIAIPLILIAFGIVDFAKAVFSSSDDAMKKAQKDFIKRLGIAILIFFVPTLLNLILSLANKVWTIISPNSCGLF